MQYANGRIFAQRYTQLYSPRMSLAARLDEAMREAHEWGPSGISQSELKRRSGVPQATISRTLKGQTIPETETIRKLAVALNITFEWLNEGIAPKYRSDRDLAAAIDAPKVRLVSSQDRPAVSPEEYAEAVKLFGSATPTAREEALRILRRSVKAAGGVDGEAVRDKT